jgi:hypothetical protein
MDDMAHRHSLLLEKIAAQRNNLVYISSQFKRPLVLADTALRAVRYLHDHPGLLAGGLATFLALRRSGLVGLAKTGWRMLYLNPSILSFTLKVLSTTNEGVASKCNTQSKKGA